MLAQAPPLHQLHFLFWEKKEKVVESCLKNSGMNRFSFFLNFVLNGSLTRTLWGLLFFLHRKSLTRPPLGRPRESKKNSFEERLRGHGFAPPAAQSSAAVGLAAGFLWR